MQALAMGMVLPKPATPWWRFLAVVAGLLGGLFTIAFFVLRAVVRVASDQSRGETEYYGGHEGGSSGGGTAFGGGSSGGGGASGRW